MEFLVPFATNLLIRFSAFGFRIIVKDINFSLSQLFPLFNNLRNVQFINRNFLQLPRQKKKTCHCAWSCCGRWILRWSLTRRVIRVWRQKSKRNYATQSGESYNPNRNIVLFIVLHLNPSFMLISLSFSVFSPPLMSFLLSQMVSDYSKHLNFLLRM